MKLYLTIIALFFSAALATFASTWEPTGVATYYSVRSLTTYPWAMHVGGTLRGLPLKGDLIATSKKSYVRLSYYPLKLINNQWIELPQPSTGGTLLDGVRLTAREGSLVERFTSRRYSFVTAPTLIASLPILADAKGEVTLNRTSHRLETLHLTPNATPEDTIAVRMDYAPEALLAEITRTRTLQDVVAQLEEVAAMHKLKPKLLVSLGASASDPLDASQPFYNDFDHDGLTDAAEVFYGTDPGNPDTDNDTFLDGDEVQKGYNPTGTGTL